MKRFKGICVALCLLMLAGCGNKEPETTSSTVSGDGFDLPGLKPATTTEAATEATTEVTTEATTEEVSGGSEDIIYYASDKALFLSPRDIKDYLDGYWELVPNGQPIMDMDVVADTFYFNGETQTAVYNRGDGEYVRFDYEAEDLFESIAGALTPYLQGTGTDTLIACGTPAPDTGLHRKEQAAPIDSVQELRLLRGGTHCIR